MKINSFNIAQMRQQQAFGFYKKCQTKLNTVTLDDFLIPFFDKFNEAVWEFDMALKPLRKSLLTDDVTRADERRDNAWRGLKMAVQLKLSHFKAKEVEIGRKADRILSTYGDPTRLAYTEESGVIHNILQDFTGVFGPELSTIGLSEWVDELQNANDAFDTLTYQRRNEQQVLVSGRSKAARKQADEAYKDLVEKINAFIILNGVSFSFEKVIKGINQLIDAEKALLKARRTRSSNRKEDDTEDME